jgi:hypothetical protein
MTRSSAAKIAALESWANTPDRAARASLGQAGLRARFEREARDRLGPDATEQQVADAAESARKAHFTRLRARRSA